MDRSTRGIKVKITSLLAHLALSDTAGDYLAKVACMRKKKGERVNDRD